MITIKAGEFMMGSPDDDPYINECPQHKVVIDRPFEVGRFAVTFEEWDAAVAAKGVDYKPYDGNWGRRRRPVINVSWHDAKAYVVWLSSVSGRNYRLLSEAEWEYCCRAGTTTAFSTGNDITHLQAQCSEKGINRADWTAEVGSFPQNPFGLYDMHGNVWEWCEDKWHDNYQNDPPADGSAWVVGDSYHRVLRGGSWGFNPQNLRSACRDGGLPDFRYSYAGFRVACDFQ